MPRAARTVREGVGIPGLPHDLGVDVARLKLMKASHQSQQYKLEDSLLKKLPEEIEKSKGFISGLEENSIVSQPIDSVYKKTVSFSDLSCISGLDTV